MRRERMFNTGKMNDILSKHKKDCGFKTRLPNYTPMSILLRMGVHMLISFLFIQLMIAINDFTPIKPVRIYDYFRVFTYFAVLSELQILIDLLLEKFFPIPKKIRLRLLVHILVGIGLLVLMFVFAKSHMVYEPGIPKPNFYLGLAIGLVFVSMFSSSLLIMRFTEKWIFSQKEMDRLKQDKLKMDYNSLQDQLNPHFLFNNLSALKSLIIYDQDRAVNFTENFTDVYRYVLQSKDKMVIRIAEELEFIEAYIKLHKVRLGNGLVTNIEIRNSFNDFEIAPLTLQLLIENAIKHNITSKDKPLNINVFVKANYLVVENNNQKKETSYSTNTGLSNLKKRYKMLTEREIIIFEDNDTFRVNIPLL